VIVIDASTVVDVLLQTPSARRIEARLFALGEVMHAPHLIDLEVMHALRRHVLQRAMSEERGEEAVNDLAIWPLTRHAHSPLLRRVWLLRNTVSAYDAAYIALAEMLNVPLLTCDGRLAASSGHRARIELA
jgi:predicted nucleic acid-binding protein